MEEDIDTAAVSEEPKRPPKHKGKHDKPKPWDDDPNIDRWTVQKFDPSWNEDGTSLTEDTSFSTLFPQYRGSLLNSCFYFLCCFFMCWCLKVRSFLDF